MIGLRRRLVATLVWIAHRCGLRRAVERYSAVTDVLLAKSIAAQSDSFRAVPFKLVPPPISFRRLEPRRVLSVNAAFAAGVLDIVIQDDGGSTDASLLSDDGTHFFVDANGDQSYDDGSSGTSELRGLLSELTQVHVLGDAGVGNFSWRNDFTASALGAPSGNAVDISHVANIDLSASASVAGNVSLSAVQSIQLGGSLSIYGNLDAQASSASGQISNESAGSLDVLGHTDLSAHTVDLGNQAGDHLSLDSLTVSSNGAVDISEDGSTTDVETRLTGASSAQSLHFSNNGSITLASGASIAVDGDLQLMAEGVDAEVDIDGSITSVDGNIDLFAGDQITVTSAASVTLGGNGTLTLNAQGSGIGMADGSQLVVDQGSVFLSATGIPGAEIHLSQVSAGSGSTANFIVVATGDVLDNTASEDANILAPTGTLVLRSLNGSIGAEPGNAGGDIDVDVQNLQFNAGAALGTVHVTDLAGGLRIHATSRAGASADISAHSPLVIAANVNVGGNSSFTAGNSALAGDNLTIDNGATVTLNSVAPATLTFNAGDNIVFLNGGQIVTTGSNSHEVILNADLDHGGVGAVDGDRGSITQNSPVTVEVTTNRLTAVAAGQIDLETLVDNLDARSTDMGDIRIGDASTIQLDRVETANGSIEVRAALDLLTLDVRAAGNGNNVSLTAGGNINSPTVSGSVMADNNVTLIANNANVYSGVVEAQHGSVSMVAFNGDVSIDSVAAETNISILAVNGSINDGQDDTLVDLT
ncbi:MAG: hypothetical protein ABI557_13590, partial [Aureliella sp.]